MINGSELSAVRADDSGTGDEGGDPGVDLTPESIANARFVTSVRGYNRDDVDAFLHGIADDYHRVLAELRDLRSAYAERVPPQASGSSEPAAASPPPEPRNAVVLTERARAEEPAPDAPTAEPTGPTAEQHGVEPVAEPVQAAAEQPDAGEAEPRPTAVEAEPGLRRPDPGQVDPDSPVASQVQALLLEADQAAWRVRDAAERDYDQRRDEAGDAMRAAEARANEVRESARRRARQVLDGSTDIAEAAGAVNQQLLEADATAAELVERARATTHEMRRKLYDGLVDAEMEARAMIEQAQREACSLIRDAQAAARRSDLAGS